LKILSKKKDKKLLLNRSHNQVITKLAYLVLEPINNEQKTIAAPKFAQILQIDPYTARLILPSHYWKVYRTGKIGELQFYRAQLQQAGIACFWLNIAQIKQIQVYQVKYFSEWPSKPTVFCQNSKNQPSSINFDWSEVTARVVGLLPVFEQVVDVNVRGKLERKTETQDYDQFCDLHLPGKNSILRIYDNGYKVQQGLKITPQANQNTIINYIIFSYIWTW
jgi:hypothetical protein